MVTKVDSVFWTSVNMASDFPSFSQAETAALRLPFSSASSTRALRPRITSSRVTTDCAARIAFCDFRGI